MPPAVVLGQGRPAGPEASDLAALALLWMLGLAAMATALSCPWETMTGLPCPLCGATGAMQHLFAGDVGGALRAHPTAVLTALCSLLAMPLLVARLVIYRHQHLHSRSLSYLQVRRWAWTAVLPLLLVQWCWTLWHH
jgi:hypothetical protein